MNKIFPKITQLSDVLPYIQDKQQIRVAKQSNGSTIICYKAQDEDTFTGVHQDLYKECRGITFHADGTIASRPLHKLSNVGKNEDAKPDVIPWDKIVRIMSKLDESMICPVLLSDGAIACKTKRTFTSAEALAATAYLTADPKKLEFVKNWCAGGYTLIFKLTSPKFPIVVLYPKEELTLLHIRDNETGHYLHQTLDDKFFRESCPFPIVENLINQFDSARSLLELAKTAEDIEGWVIQAENGEMWKIKTLLYRISRKNQVK